MDLPRLPGETRSLFHLVKCTKCPVEQDFTGVSKIAVNQESTPYGHQVNIIDNSIEWQFFNDSES
jgi:hypothetical protein